MSKTKCPVCGQWADFLREEAEDGAPVLRDDATQCLSAAQEGERMVYVHVGRGSSSVRTPGPDFGVTDPSPIGGRGPPINEPDWDTRPGVSDE